jgi:hypothetical protein
MPSMYSMATFGIVVFAMFVLGSPDNGHHTLARTSSDM